MLERVTQFPRVTFERAARLPCIFWDTTRSYRVYFGTSRAVFACCWNMSRSYLEFTVCCLGRTAQFLRAIGMIRAVIACCMQRAAQLPRVLGNESRSYRVLLGRLAQAKQSMHKYTSGCCHVLSSRPPPASVDRRCDDEAVGHGAKDCGCSAGGHRGRDFVATVASGRGHARYLGRS